ncbi:major allergen I polypeptide chain 2-like [Equus przewalskii]|uniref:Major allergen I polypeptide chain 2-like n=1 Tax=Equus przewalskii TaxID=9798 RepID=A0ABM2ENF3_EQUPR
MKGALLVLALLVTRELGIKMAEACPSFYAVLGVLSLGSKTLLDTSLNLVNATEPEKVAMGKIQDCYNEAGVITKISDLIIMGTITTSPECISHALSTLTTDVQEGISKLTPLGR